MPEPGHIRALRAWDIDDRIPDDRYAWVFAHPNFAAACRELSLRMIAAAEHDATFDGLAKDLGRYVSGVWAAYLHLTGGLTLPRLKELCAASGLLSPGRARAMLLYLQFLGFVRPVPSQRGEARRYAATPALMRAFRIQLQQALEAASLIEPATAPVAIALEDDAVLEVWLRHQGVGFFLSSSRADTEAPIIRLLYHRHAGAQLTHMLLTSAPFDGHFPPRGPARLSVAHVARQLRVSRAHIMRMLDDFERQGWVRREADGAILFQAPAAAPLRLVFATRLMGFIICAAKSALATLEQRADPPLAMPPPAHEPEAPPPLHAP
ncbi:MarR family transcriptional regulator [Phenylobacterium montanum]|uniref:MarR family transcriptional regulator n=1 Tax=Phenylobacterium montanum TaxID=2823693 RepID=A0A975IV68_9CAUL|nr:helix-turn-helix domain-containing protein [Caulobacter sp. S6]QUD88682.1 MarR family transcriptional regulator [Caulobacter sp. S6]